MFLSLNGLLLRLRKCVADVGRQWGQGVGCRDERGCQMLSERVACERIKARCL